ncbi:unnamed protein product [Rhizophagus irregularis]|uniref:Uncharacterized protein n=1 Tax=Rhizophagus irregularis TaxID=588596 RepID=A0A916E5I6_9GLOM|nr:unnamed protein product [Rhizophagus irregularis]CAB5361298.1 unnamed protein product [Rhizophagus irregularis]
MHLFRSWIKYTCQNSCIRIYRISLIIICKAKISIKNGFNSLNLRHEANADSHLAGTSVIVRKICACASSNFSFCLGMSSIPSHSWIAFAILLPLSKKSKNRRTVKLCVICVKGIPSVTIQSQTEFLNSFCLGSLTCLRVISTR